MHNRLHLIKSKMERQYLWIICLVFFATLLLNPLTRQNENVSGKTSDMPGLKQHHAALKHKRMDWMDFLLCWNSETYHKIKSITADIVTSGRYNVNDKLRSSWKNNIDRYNVNDKFRNSLKNNIDSSSSRIRRQGLRPDFKVRDPCDGFTYGTCDFNEGNLIKTCFCDDLCIRYNDCCESVNKTVPEQSKTSADNRNGNTDLFQYISCEFIKIPNTYVVTDQGFFMVTSCPDNFSGNKDFRRKCEESKNINVPVTDLNGVTYRNVYCALCHGINSYQYWTIIITTSSCSFQTLIDYYYYDTAAGTKGVTDIKDCPVYYVPPSVVADDKQGFPRYCFKQRGTLFVHNKKECERYLSPVLMDHSVLLRNHNCMYGRNFYKCWDPVVNPYTLELVQPAKRADTYFSMTVMYEFEFSNDRDVDCFSDTIYGISQEMWTWNRFCDVKQIRNFFLSYEIKFEYHGSLTIESPKTEVLFKRALVMYILSISRNIYLGAGTYKGEMTCTDDVKQNKTNCCKFNFILDFFIYKNYTSKEIRHLKSAIENMQFTYIENVKNTTDTHVVSRLTETSNISCDGDQQMGFVKYVDFTKNLFTNISSVLNESLFDREESAIPESSHIETEVTSHDHYNEGTPFKIIKWIKNYPQSGNASLIPKDSVSRSFKIHQILFIVIFVVTGVSCIALVITIWVFMYSDNGNKTDLSVTICVNVCVSFFIASLLLICGIWATQIQILCSTISVTFHFTVLCGFQWITLYSVIVIRLLIKSTQNSVHECDPDKLYSKAYLFRVGYGIPLIIVAFCVIVDFFQFKDFTIGYGDGYCQPSHFPFNIMVLSGPITLSLFLDMALLIVSEILTSRRRASITSMNTQIMSSYIIKYLVMCTLLVIIWSFGIFVQVKNNDSKILQYTQIILIGSQGFVISSPLLIGFRYRVLT